MGNIFEESKVVFNSTRVCLGSGHKQEEVKKTGEKLKEEMQISVEVLNNAKKEAVLILKKAEEEGYSKGFGQGYTEGMKKAEIEISRKYQEMFKEAEDIIEDTRVEKMRCIEKIKNESLEIALTLAKKILNYEIENNDDVLLGIFEKVTAEYASQGKARIYVSPKNKRIIETRLIEADKEEYKISDIDIIETRGMDDGGMIAETEKGNINAGIESQFEHIRSILQKAERMDNNKK